MWGRSHLLPGLLLASLCHLAHLLPPEGSVPPTLFLPQRALPGPHFWDNSALLLLAPCQHPPGAGRLHPVSSAVAGAEGRQLGGLGPLPLPRAHTHRQPGPTQGAGRCSRVPSPGWGPPALIATSQMAGAALQGIFRQGGGSGVEGAGRKGGAVGLVLSCKRNLENVALLWRLWSWGAGGLELGVRDMPPEDAHIHRNMCPKHHDSPLHRAKPSDTGQPLGPPRVWGAEQTPHPRLTG